MAADKELRNQLRNRLTEITGDYVVPRLSQLPTTNPVRQIDGQTQVDPATGKPIRDRYSEFQADAYREDPNYGGQVFNGNDSSAYGMDVFDEETNFFGDRLTPVNPENLNIPTSTSNASRPRTLAAGYYLYVGERAKPYADQRGKLTVVFRDGTFYNYYNVPPGTWQTFKSSISKGPMLNRKNQFQGGDGILLGYPHGPADLSEVPVELQRQVYRVARTASSASVVGRTRSIQVGDRKIRTANYVSTSSQKRVSSAKNPSANRGKNPAAKMGKNPYQK